MSLANYAHFKYILFFRGSQCQRPSAQLSSGSVYTLKNSNSSMYYYNTMDLHTDA